jgi:arginase
MDLGQQRRGVDMGPSAVRYAGLQDRLERLGYEVHDHGNVTVPIKEEVLQAEKRAGEKSDPVNAHHLNAVIDVCAAIYTQMTKSVHPGEFAIFLGGDHSISIGTVSGVASRGKHGVIWVDAHADYNTPQTSPSGNIHGMPVAVLLGEGIPALSSIGGKSPKLDASQVVMVGIRDLDAPERDRLAKSGIGVFTMTDIDEHGIGQIARRILDRLSQFDTIHVSLDMDSLDPSEAPGVGTPVRGGLTYREAHLLMEVFAQSGKVRSLDIVEVNPILDDSNKTAELAVGLAASLLGKRIL